MGEQLRCADVAQVVFRFERKYEISWSVVCAPLSRTPHGSELHEARRRRLLDHGHRYRLINAVLRSYINIVT